MNIFDADIYWKPIWYILGSGPSLPTAYYRIMAALGRDWNQVLSVNGAIRVPDWAAPDYWLVSDINVSRYEWFWPTYESTDAVRIFGPQYQRNGVDAGDYTFDTGPAFRLDNVRIIDGKLCDGCTIGGMALQFAIQCNAREIYLAGFDHQSREYFKPLAGNADECNLPDNVHDGTWNTVKRFSRLIEIATERGIIIKSLTETQLEIEVI